MKIELGKDHEYRTRDGKAVRIHAVDLVGTLPVLYSVRDKDGWRCRTATEDGHFLNVKSEDDNDIVEKPVVRELWINDYPNDNPYGHTNREIADRHAKFDRRALLHIQYRECDAVDGVIHLRSWKENTDGQCSSNSNIVST